MEGMLTMMSFVSKIFIIDQCKFWVFNNLTKCIYFINSLSFSSNLWPTKISIALYILASKTEKTLSFKNLTSGMH